MTEFSDIRERINHLETLVEDPQVGLLCIVRRIETKMDSHMMNSTGKTNGVLLSKRAAGVFFSIGVIMAGLIAGLVEKLIR